MTNYIYALLCIIVKSLHTFALRENSLTPTGYGCGLCGVFPDYLFAAGILRPLNFRYKISDPSRFSVHYYGCWYMYTMKVELVVLVRKVLKF